MRMNDDAPLAFRWVRGGLRALSRVGGRVLDRALAPPRGAARASAAGGCEREREAGASGGTIPVRFGDQSVSVARGATVLEAARLARVELRHYCGGNCSCGTCRVEIVHGERALSPVASMEAMVLGDAARRRGDRLACQAEILGPVTVHVPEFF